MVDVDLFTTPAASAGNHLSVGLENLFNLNRISHNRKQYITLSDNCNLFFAFLFIFFTRNLARHLLARGPPPKVVKFYFRKAARINLATSHRTLHDVDALALEPSAQLVYCLFARVSKVRRDLWVWGKVERAFPCRLETKAELDRFALDFFVGRRLMLVCHTQLSFATLVVCNSQVVIVDSIYISSVNSNDFVNVSVCPLSIEFFSLKQSDHIFLFCFDWKRGVDSVTACQNVLACELWVSASLEHYVPELVWFSFSHNFKQSITIFFKSQELFLPFVDHIFVAFVADRPEVAWIPPLPNFDFSAPLAFRSIFSLAHLANQYFFIFCCHFSHNSKQSITILFKSQHFISTFFPCG